ncbi:MAG: hypothetical protein B7Z55_12050 [Planctomycetales bacterium 12-60-4]|nr:MAG: hypothetical protein B7Z55_12050 [Planctomycetales bacterium 12-60-4]
MGADIGIGAIDGDGVAASWAHAEGIISVASTTVSGAMPHIQRDIVSPLPGSSTPSMPCEVRSSNPAPTPIGMAQLVESCFGQIGTPQSVLLRLGLRSCQAYQLIGI